MKLFIDSADIDDITLAFSYGVIDGITTNPSLIKQAVSKHKIPNIAEYISQILVLAQNTPVSLEVRGGTADDMYAQARALYTKFKTKFNFVVIKIPINSQIDEHGDMDEMQGIQVIKRLSSEGIPTNVTLIFSPEQALLAAKAGATYVSPFVGREDDYIRSFSDQAYDKNDYFVPKDGLEDNGIDSGLELVRDIVTMFKLHNLQTKVLAASLRNPRQVREAALLGADVATVPLSVIKMMVRHPKTIEGMIIFTQDFVPEYNELFK
jgi:transaldolase